MGCSSRKTTSFARAINKCGHVVIGTIIIVDKIHSLHSCIVSATSTMPKERIDTKNACVHFCVAGQVDVCRSVLEVLDASSSSVTIT